MTVIAKGVPYLNVLRGTCFLYNLSPSCKYTVVLPVAPPIMDPSNLDKQNQLEVPRFLDFPHLPDGATKDGKPRLNRYSSTITRGHDFPGAQVFLSLAPISD